MRKKLDIVARLPNGQAVELYLSTQMIECDATSLMLKVYAEMIDTGHNLGGWLGFTNTSKVVWAQTPAEEVCGGICFHERPDMLDVWIVLSFTAPKWRGQGINKLCHNWLEVHARSIGLPAIASSVHIDNTSRLRSAEKVGLKPLFYRMHKQL